MAASRFYSKLMTVACGLAVTASAVRPASTTVKAASPAVETTPASGCESAACAASRKSSADVTATYKPASADKSAVAHEPTSAESTTAIESAPVESASIEPTAAIEPAMKPRTRADEDAAREPVWAVIPVGRAVIRGIAVITVGTDRSVTVAISCVNRSAIPYSHRHSLGVRERRTQHANSQQTCNP